MNESSAEDLFTKSILKHGFGSKIGRLEKKERRIKKGSDKCHLNYSFYDIVGYYSSIVLLNWLNMSMMLFQTTRMN